MAILQGLCSYENALWAVWKGVAGDDRLFYSTFLATVGSIQSPQTWASEQLLQGLTSSGPSIATYGDELVLAWKGEFTDERLFFSRFTNQRWSPQAQIPNVASSVGPTLAQYGADLYAAWKGIGSDQLIYYATFDGAGWSTQSIIPGVATSVGPSLCAWNGLLYAAWRGRNNDESLWWASFDGANWSGQAKIPGAASSVGPSITVFAGKLYAAWKGVTGDQELWYSSFDGATWAAQQLIPGVASSIGPTLAEYYGRLYAMWKGMDDDEALWYSSFDGARWAPQQRAPGFTGQDVPANIGLRMQFQETSEWCWLALAASVAHYYGAPGAITQCNLMTQVGHQHNKWTSDIVCCPTGAVLRAYPDLVPKLNNPYDSSAEFCLETVGIPQVCIKSGGVGDALVVNGNLGGYRNAMSLDEVTAEITAGRPVVVGINWNALNAGSHFVAIVGVLNDQLLISDPANGQSIHSYEDFPAAYFGGATIGQFVLTKATSPG